MELTVIDVPGSWISKVRKNASRSMEKTKAERAITAFREEYGRKLLPLFAETKRAITIGANLTAPILEVATIEIKSYSGNEEIIRRMMKIYEKAVD